MKAETHSEVTKVPPPTTDRAVEASVTVIGPTTGTIKTTVRADPLMALSLVVVAGFLVIGMALYVVLLALRRGKR